MLTYSVEVCFLSCCFSLLLWSSFALEVRSSPPPNDRSRSCFVRRRHGAATAWRKRDEQEGGGREGMQHQLATGASHKAHGKGDSNNVRGIRNIISRVDKLLRIR